MFEPRQGGSKMQWTVSICLGGILAEHFFTGGFDGSQLSCGREEANTDGCAKSYLFLLYTFLFNFYTTAAVAAIGCEDK